MDNLNQVDVTEILLQIIMEFVKNGFVVQAQTANTAQLIRQKNFSAGKAAAFGVLYLAARAAKKQQTAFIKVSQDGSYSITNEAGNTKRYRSGSKFDFGRYI